MPSRIEMATGEGALFKDIWDSLEPDERVSFITGHTLADPYEMRAYYFAHCLGKGAYPEFRLYRKNIVLLNRNEHKLWDFGKDKIKANPHLMQLWQKMFELEEELKIEYHEKSEY